MTEQEKKLIELVKSLPFERGSDIPDEENNLRACMCLSGRTYGCTGELIELIDNNPGKSLGEIWKLALRDVFPPLEIVDGGEFDEALRKAE